MSEFCQHYADALFSSLSPKERKEALSALEAFTDRLLSDPDFFELLKSYNLTAKEKRDVISRVYGKTFSSIPHLIPFLYVVSDHHRMRDFPKILSCYRSLVNEEEGIKEGIVYSAERLSKERLEKIEEAIGKRLGSKVSLHMVIDSHLLGGVKVAVDGKVFDGSLEAKLQGLTRNLKGGTLS